MNRRSRYPRGRIDVLEGGGSIKVPTCPHHGDLVLDLARGRLSDADAMAAELERESCPHCAQWWNATFTVDATAEVDVAVAQAFADFSPAAGRRRGWLAAAAAAVLAVGVGTTVMMWSGGETSPVVAVQAPAAETVLSDVGLRGWNPGPGRGGHSRTHLPRPARR